MKTKDTSSKYRRDTEMAVHNVLNGSDATSSLELSGKELLEVVNDITQTRLNEDLFNYMGKIESYEAKLKTANVFTKRYYKRKIVNVKAVCTELMDVISEYKQLN